MLGEEAFVETNWARDDKPQIDRAQALEAQHVATKIFTAQYVGVHKSEGEAALVAHHTRVVNTRCGKGACGKFGLWVYRFGGGAISDFYHACFDAT